MLPVVEPDSIRRCASAGATDETKIAPPRNRFEAADS
jgi:hypothetical protein